MDLRERMLAELAARGDQFLASLAFQLTLCGRMEYVAAGNDPARSAERLAALNEVVHRAVSQVSTSLAGRPAYPSGDVVVTVLMEKAAIGGPACEHALASAVEFATRS